MTRKEAVAVLEAFIENPLFNNTHKAAFNIAIHDIKQRHDWDINNLILINKENYEPIDREMLDNLRAELHATAEMHDDGDCYLRDEWIDEIFDEYKTESEDKE